MKKYQIRAFAAFIFFVSGAVVAGAEEAYVGVGYHSGTYTPPDGNSFSTVNGLSIRLGKYLSDNLAIEGRVLFGASNGSKSVDVPPIGVVNAEIGISNGASIFLKGELPLSDTSKFYALLGYSQLELELKLSGGIVGTSKNSESGLGYGVGLEGDFSNDVGAYIEYVVYPGGTGNADYDYTGLNVGISKKF